jgi:RNA polymerase sigma factor for flagellar operon FliA
VAIRTHTDRVDELVAESLPLVRAIVAGMAAHYPRHCDRDDLVAAGTLGLVEAARRFDPARGVPFERWAALRIRGAVVDAVRAVDFAPRSLRATARDLEQTRQTLSCELGRTPSSEELAQRMGLSLTALVSLEGQLHRSTVLSLDAPSPEGADQDATLASIIMDAGGADPLEQLEHRERDSYVQDALRLLPERVRAVVVGYFLEGRTSAELADELGVTESRVSQLRSEGLRMMRDGIAAQYAEAPSCASTLNSRQASYNASLARRSAFSARLTGSVPAQRPAPAPLSHAG